jgi:hypothetical protein
MAFEIPGFQRSWIAGGTAGTPGSDLSISQTINSIVCANGYQYMFVKLVAGLLVPVTLATDKPVGVLQNKPAPGQPGTVMISGVTRVRSTDAAIVVGSEVFIDAFGMVKSTGTANQAVGVAEEASANGTGFIIAISLKPFGAIV